MKEKFLPIGTVVLLKEATKRIMITGYCSAIPENPNKTYDYIGCLFPEGNLAGDDVALFDHEQVATIIHLGLDDDEFKKLNEEIRKALAEEEDNQAPTMVQTLPATPDGTMPSMTPENLNSILNSIKAQGIPEPIKEPTAFDEEALKKPVFTAPTLASGTQTIKQEKKEDEEEVKISSEFSIDETEQAEETKKVNDGTPVLQLQLIGGDGSIPSIPTLDASPVSDTSIVELTPVIEPLPTEDSGSAPAMPELTRL